MIPIDQIEALIPKARDLCAGLSRDQFLWRPEPGAWSVAECLDHLNRTNRLYVDSTADAIRRARSEGLTGAGPFKLGWLEGRFVAYLEPPYRMKSKAPASFRPAPDASQDAVIADWETLHGRLLQLAREADGLHLTKVKMPSPVASWMKVSLLGVFYLIPAHDRRHLWQASRVLAMRGGL